MIDPRFRSLHSRIGIPLLSCLLMVSACSKEPGEISVEVPPLFPNSIVSTEIDFIRSTDPDAFVELVYIGREDKEMPDKRSDDLFDINTFVFEASFTNGKKVEIWAHSDFGSIMAAQEYAEKLCGRLGKLPEFMRDVLKHVVIHKGDEGAFAEKDAQFFVLYSDNMDLRISNNDLEETVFHETVHVALDLPYATSESWLKAQNKDRSFITEYAQDYPMREDLAETAIFVYTLQRYPSRLSVEIEEWMATNIPHRLAFLRTVFE
ncbi:MAG: hypothetical protein AAGM67_00515 [Bacteroidota bacterium]